MPISNQQRVAIEERRRAVAPLALRRQRVIAIHRAVNEAGHKCSRRQVERDIRFLEGLWQKELVDDPAAVKAQELAELDEMERTAQLKMAAQGLPDKDQQGWAKLILEIKRQRADLLGLDAPVKQEITGKDSGPIELTAITLAQRLQRIVDAEAPMLPAGIDGSYSLSQAKP